MRKDKHFMQLIQLYFKALLTAFFILFYGISIHSVQSYTTWGPEGSPRIDDDDVKNTIFSGRKEKPEIEVIQPSLLYVYDGEETDFRITLQNKSKEKTYRINILEDKGRNPNTPLIFYSPPKKIVLEPGRSITVNCRVSVALKQKNPEKMKSTLYLKIETEIGLQMAIEIPINVFVPSFIIIKTILKNKKHPFAVVNIRNIGGHGLVNQVEFHAKIDGQSLNIIKLENIKALETFELVFTSPEKLKVGKNSLLKLKIKTTKQPIHIWELPDYPIVFGTLIRDRQRFLL